MNPTTTVAIDLETRALLSALKEHPRETMGDVIRRLAEEKRESAVTPEEVRAS